MPLDSHSLELRRNIVVVVNASRRGHIGSAFSIVEILRVLYEKILKVDPKNPMREDRDRFILSKGHGCLALYAVLAEHDFFPKEELLKFCRSDSNLGGHPQYGKVPGVEASTGSLGHGLSIGVGTALSGLLDGKKFKTIVLLGDGECDEGSIWEAVMSAAKHKLENLLVMVDYNKMQSYSTTYEVLDLEPFAHKWQSFGFDTQEADGHDMKAIFQAVKKAFSTKGKPHVIICHTVKGKGVASIEGNASWHHKSKLSDEDISLLMKELDE
jgi:transketolase